MADRETGLNIPVSAYADKNSAKQAVNDLVKGVLTSLKDGYIEVPAEIKTSFEKGSKELDKAQKDVIKQWEKMSKEGFSLSEDYLDDLINKYKKFKSLAGKESKGNSKQARWLTDTIGSSLQPYIAQRKELENIIASFEKSTKNIKKSNTSHISALNTQKKRESDVKITGPKGYKTNTGVDLGKTNEHSFRLSESSPYGSKWAIAMAKIKSEEDLKTKSSTKVWNDKTYKPEQKGQLSRATTDKEFNQDIASKALSELKNLIVAIEKGTEDITPQMITDQLGIVKDVFQKNGKDLEETSIALKNALEKPYSDSSIKRLGGTKGGDKGVGVGHTLARETQRMVYDLWSKLIEATDPAIIYAKRFAKDIEEVSKSVTKTKKSTTKKQSTSTYEQAKNESRKSESYKEIQDLVNTVNTNAKEITDATKIQADNTDKQTRLDIIENSAERVADSKEEELGKQSITSTELQTQDINKNSESGFNSDKNASKLNISASKTNTILDQTINSTLESLKEILLTISNNLAVIINKSGGMVKNTSDDKRIDKIGLPDLYRSFKNGKWTVSSVKDLSDIDRTNYAKLRHKMAEAAIEHEREQLEKGEHPSQQRYLTTKLSKDLADAYNDGKVINAIRKAFGMIGTGPTANQIMSASQSELEKLRAERISKFGLTRTDKETATGDRAQAFRTKQIYGWGRNIQNPFKDLRLSEGINIDSKGILDGLQTFIQKNMFNTQTGGILRNLFGSMTGYIGMPSLEKSRAEADALNQIMANIRDVTLELLQQIQSKETDLRGLERAGKARFDAQGRLSEDSSPEAKKLFVDLEEQKLALRGVLADASAVENVVAKTDGNITDIIKKLGFVSPELRKNNKIIQNINAGLDKNGKALRFQTRTGEVINYSLQLMARHVGQIWKNWLMMLNPINLIKKAFNDFASYDVKWQRTMNVIKYNLRRIVRPMMEWIAQQLVNIIGLVNALMKGIGKVFGKNWDLFDQSAANAEKMREELEQAANVTASFDELHDIGSDNSAANDLLGDIYTPQWDGLYDMLENIGRIISNIIKLVSNFSFWDWLKLAGAALLGFLALKWLLGVFGIGKNPLKSMADGFSFLEKAVGWATLIWAFAEFTKQLKEFIDVVGHMKPEEVSQALKALAIGIGTLVVAIVSLEIVTAILQKIFGFDWMSLFGLAAEVGAFALFTKALGDFINTVGHMKEVEVDQALKALAKGFIILGVAVVYLEAATAAIQRFIGLNWMSMLGLASIVASFALVTEGLASFAEAIKGLTHEDMVNGLKLFAGSIAVLTAAISILLLVLASTAPATAGLALIVASISLVVLALAVLVRATKDCGNDVKLVLEGLSKVAESIAKGIVNIILSIGTVISNTIETITSSIISVIGFIISSIESLISKIAELAISITSVIGGTIKNIIESVGNLILKLIDKIIKAVPMLLNAIISFCGKIGPTVEKLANSVMRIITRVVNFAVSAVEYLINLVIDGINSIISAVNSLSQYINISIPKVPNVEIRKFVPQYEKGTNYVPSDGLAYLHQGEAVIPKKYNQPFTADTSPLENAIEGLTEQVERIGNKVDQGIAVKGQFVQKGSDLVATVQKVSNKLSNNVLNNKVYAR